MKPKLKVKIKLLASPEINNHQENKRRQTWSYF